MSQADDTIGGILVLTTDLPYFPGKMGVDYFNLRHLARHHRVGVVAPCYENFPTESVANLESFLSGSYFWPRKAGQVTTMLSEEPRGLLRSWVWRVPGRVRAWLHRRMLGLSGSPADAFEKLCILSNCAPQLLRAIHDRNWQALVLIQTNIEPWMDYLPPMGGKVVYFHDVRSDYLGRTLEVPKRGMNDDVRAIRQQEQDVVERADVVGFVSTLDQERASRLFHMHAKSGVAAISIDTSYYVPAPPEWEVDPRRVVLFTGHLAHPPNVDAVLYFLREIWPRVLELVPDAVFQAVGMVPAPAICEAMMGSRQCELHANVPDIRPYFWNANTYLVPMRFGGGVRQKIFEAWSIKVPVVCTTMAAEGSGAVDGIHCCMEDDPETMAHCIADTLLRPESYQALVEAAKDYVEANNSIEAAAPGFARLVDQAVRIKAQKPFKLLFDLRWMELGHAGGIEQATYELLSTIGQLDRRNEYRVMAPRSACCEWNFPPGFKVRMEYSDPAEREGAALRDLLANGLGESVGAMSVLNTAMRNLANYRRLDFDMVHSVAGYTHPDLIGFPGILTINDLQHLHFPEFFTPAQFEERERLYRSSAEAAKHIICISEFTRQDVHRQYGIPLGKMTTVWIVPSRNVWQPIPDSRRAQLLAAMGVSGPYLFFPAHCWPHKNHTRLLEAFAKVLGRLPENVNLVMTGGAFPPEHPAAALMRDPELARRATHLGYRSPLEIRALFQGCMSLVFPSLFEGYGMPVAEAIIAGKPVLCSNVTSLPEIAGDAALTFNPVDIDAIGEAIIEVAGSADLRAALSEAALRRRSLFAARRSAVQTMSVYQNVYNELYGAIQ